MTRLQERIKKFKEVKIESEQMPADLADLLKCKC
jgi:hypothetical protein